MTKPIRRQGERLGNPDALGIHELPNAEIGQLSAIPGPLNPAEREPGIRLDLPVHMDVSGLDLGYQPLGPAPVLRPERGSEAVGRGVGQPNGVGFVPRERDGGNGTEGFFVEGGDPGAVSTRMVGG